MRIEQVPPDQTGEILKRYLALEPITAGYFDATADSEPEAFAAEAERHPVFRLLPN